MCIVADVVWDVFDGDAHVFMSWKRGAKIKIRNVNGHELCSRSGNNAVKKTFDCGEIRGGCADLASILNAVTANNGDMDTLRFGFEWFFGSDNAKIGGEAARGAYQCKNEAHSVGARGHVG